MHSGMSPKCVVTHNHLCFNLRSSLYRAGTPIFFILICAVLNDAAWLHSPLLAAVILYDGTNINGYACVCGSLLSEPCSICKCLMKFVMSAKNVSLSRPLQILFPLTVLNLHIGLNSRISACGNNLKIGLDL